jgi:hypothetical protein
MCVEQVRIEAQRGLEFGDRLAIVPPNEVAQASGYM